MDRLCFYACSLALLIAGLAFWPSTTDTPGLMTWYALPKALATILPTFLIALYLLVCDKKRLQTVYLTDVLIFLFLATQLFTWAIHQTHWSYLAVALSRTSYMFLLYWAASQLDRQQKRNIGHIFLFVATAIAVLAIIESLFPLPWLRVGSPVSFLGNRNQVAIYCTCGFVFLISYLLRGQRGGWLHTLWLFPLTVALTRTRSMWLFGMIFLGLILPWISLILYRSGKPWAVKLTWRRTLFCLTVVIFTLNTFPWKGLNWREKSPYRASFTRLLDTKTGTGRTRKILHQVGFSMFKEAPFIGLGPGGWRTNLTRLKASPQSLSRAQIYSLSAPLSDPLRVLVDFGIVGLGLVFAVWLIIATSTLRRFLVSPPEQLVETAYLGVLGVLVFASFFQLPFLADETKTLACVLTGFLRKGTPQLERRWPTGVKRFFLVVLAILTITVASLHGLAKREALANFSHQGFVKASKFFPLPQIGSILYHQRLVVRDLENCNEVSAMLERVLSWHPNDSELRNVLERCGQKGS